MKRPQHHGASNSRKPTAPKTQSATKRSRITIQRAERDEVRRFTEGSRRQRLIRLTVTGSVLGFIALVVGIVLSPLMTLTTIEVTGRANVDEKVIVGSAKEQIGTPLALIDYEAISKRLGAVLQIQSFSTEVRPPHTLVIRVVERTPIGAIATTKGWNIVDPAGVIIGTSPTAPADVPELQVAKVKSAGFGAAVKVLLALPPALRANVGVIAATSTDNVTLVLRSVPHQIHWGSAEKSTLKAAVLDRALVIASTQGGVYNIDVSAPDTLIMNRAK